MGLFLMPRISIRSAAPLSIALRGLLAMIMLLLALHTGGFLDRIGSLLQPRFSTASATVMASRSVWFFLGPGTHGFSASRADP
jgi:hypothetical protein